MLIYFSEDGGRLEAIDCFLEQCIPTVKFPSALFHLGLDRRLESFSKESNEVGLFWSPVSIKLDKDGLEMR